MGNEKPAKKENLHKNHRENMRKVYYSSGLESLPDHTVLELLLYFGIPMRDTNETAHLLIERFGSFSAVLQAGMADLRSVPGMTENAACLLSMLLPLFRRYEDDLLLKRPVISSVEDVERVVRPKLIDTVNERFFAVFSDPADKLISVRLVSEGGFSSAELDWRGLVSAALETKAKNVILVHNHPSGILSPSAEDVRLTGSIRSYLEVIDVRVKDHVILTADASFSMASHPKFTELFD